MNKDYKEFCSSMKKLVEDRFPKEKYTVELHSVMKNNSVRYEGIVIHAEGVKISPNFYLNTLYTRYQQGKGLQELVNKIVEQYYETVRESGNIQIDFSFERCREKIVFRLVSAKKNKEILKTIPYITCLDLAIVFYVVVEQNEEEVGSFQISERLLDSWEIDVEELFLIAKENTRRLFPVEIFNMYHMIEQMLKNGPVDEELEDYINDEFLESHENVPLVITNKSKINGAAVIFYDGILEKLSDILQGDYYLIPSSVHEMLAVAYSERLKPADLKAMVVDVNKECVLEDEVLSENVYFYHSVDQTLKICIS